MYVRDCRRENRDVERAQRVTISTHVLDTSMGRPAAGVAVRLLRQEGSGWVDVSRAETDADGRVAALLPPGAAGAPGTFRLTFDAAAHFAARGQDTFYASIAIDFVVRDASQHYHVPLLLSPFGYSTYRGS
jgi:5-hydroxyisourate hydrolase